MRLLERRPDTAPCIGGRGRSRTRRFPGPGARWGSPTWEPAPGWRSDRGGRGGRGSAMDVASEAGDETMAATQPSRRRRRAAVLPAGLAAAIAAIALLSRARSARWWCWGMAIGQEAAVLDETFQPAPSTAAVVVATPRSPHHQCLTLVPVPTLDPEREPEPHGPPTDPHSCADRAAESEGDRTSYGETHAPPSEDHCWGTGARPGRDSRPVLSPRGGPRL